MALIVSKGTGKTTTARKMGQVYFDMGFLSSTEVIECSVSDLVGQYVGQTGPKTRQLFRKALGKVLFIDEAYRLNEGSFSKEATDELVGMLTQEEFAGKLIVILAGYDKDMNQLMASNPGLSSRFPEDIHFPSLSPQACLSILESQLKAQISCAELFVTSGDAYQKMVKIFSSLSLLPSWGNARDVKTLAQQMIRVAYKTPSLQLSGADAVVCLTAMLNQRRIRATCVPTPAPATSSSIAHTLAQHLSPRIAPETRTRTIHAKNIRKQPSHEHVTCEKASKAISERDTGISDDVWDQLQNDKQGAVAERARQETAIRRLEKAVEEAGYAERVQASSEIQQAEKEALIAVTTQCRDALEAEHQCQAEKRRKEARAQEKLRAMGVCPVGFNWIKQASGYRCSGGAHWVSFKDLGSL